MSDRGWSRSPVPAIRGYFSYPRGSLTTSLASLGDLGRRRRRVTISWSVDQMERVFGVGGPLVGLQVLSAKFGLKDAGAVHRADHRHNRLVIAANHAKIKLGLYTVAIAINVLHRYPGSTHIARDHCLKVCKQPRPPKGLDRDKFVRCHQKLPLFRA